ncbi:hypothetical protein KUDE01_009262, partial [Dissostichus eleginoides]
MQGLGKTERGEQIRDIDLTSLRSTMPASGPLQKQPRAQKDLKGRRNLGSLLACARFEVPYTSFKSE